MCVELRVCGRSLMESVRRNNRAKAALSEVLESRLPWEDAQVACARADRAIGLALDRVAARKHKVHASGGVGHKGGGDGGGPLVLARRATHYFDALMRMREAHRADRAAPGKLPPLPFLLRPGEAPQSAPSAPASAPADRGAGAQPAQLQPEPRDTQ